MAIKKRAAAKKQEFSRYRWYRWKIKMIGVGTIINSAATVGGGWSAIMPASSFGKISRRL